MRSSVGSQIRRYSGYQKKDRFGSPQESSWERRDNYKSYGSRNNWDKRGNKGGSGRGWDKKKDRNRNQFSNRGSDAEGDRIINRNKKAISGAEGDGLLGMSDYEVDITKLAGKTWTDLVPTKEGESEGTDTELPSSFSPVLTSYLADHKLLSRVLVNSLQYNRKYERLTTVQAQTIIPVLRNESVIVRAKTGTGKTAAFAVPILQKVLEAKRQGVQGVKALIISPTRELAQQIADEIGSITAYGELRGIKVQCFVGGLSKDHQLRLAFGRNPVVDIAIATPGRLNDILENNPEVLQHFSELKFKVLDEADMLLHIGFRPQLDKIRDILATATNYEQVPTLLFSATTDSAVTSFARNELGGKINIIDTVPKDEPTAAELVDQTAIFCEQWAQVYEAALVEIQKQVEASQGKYKAIVFLPSVLLVENFKMFCKRYFKETNCHEPSIVHSLHGQMTQAKRQHASDAFRKANESILITTDVVARGMDFPAVTHVVQIGIPQDVAQYIHRIGRTARIGNKGKSVLLLTKFEKLFLNALKDKQNVNLQPEVFQSNDETSKIVWNIGQNLLGDESEANDLFNNLLGSMGSLKRAYKIDGQKFIRANEEFARMLGNESPRLVGYVHRSWISKDFSQRGRSNRSGGSRYSRMKW